MSRRLRAVCRDGTTIPCASFEVVEGGVVLLDADGERTGYVPDAELRYVLRDSGVDERDEGGSEAAAAADAARARSRRGPPSQRDTGESDGERVRDAVRDRRRERR